MCGRVKETGQGCWQMHRQACTSLLYMCEGFSYPKCRSRQQWCHLMMSLISFLCILGVGIKRSMHETREQSSWVHFHSVNSWSFGLSPQLVNLGSHRPSNWATLVPLKEWNYNQIGKCSLFVQLYVLKVILGTFRWCALVNNNNNNGFYKTSYPGDTISKMLYI